MYKKLGTIEKKIAEEKADKAFINEFSFIDCSVQAELRLSTAWDIKLSVDYIHFPKQLSSISENSQKWREMAELENKIRDIADVKTGHAAFTEKINSKTKIGLAKRRELEKNFRINAGNLFLSDCRAAKKQTKKLNKKIAALQAQQKALLPQLRKANSEYLSGRKAEKAETARENAEALSSGEFWKAEKAETARENAEALSSGEFWKADKGALKDYFHPPFGKNYLVDISEKWRAALYIELESSGYKSGYGGWRHKLTATGEAYLCGIDDNGDEWGHRIYLGEYMDINNYGDLDYSGACVEWAMAELFSLPLKKIACCHRQGDLLFCPAEIPESTEMYVEEKWSVRESHEVWSPNLQRNGHYISSDRDIVVSHTSHEPVYLPAGSYELHTLQVADAD